MHVRRCSTRRDADGLSHRINVYARTCDERVLAVEGLAWAREQEDEKTADIFSLDWPFENVESSFVIEVEYRDSLHSLVATR